jgi:hypothetical protein
MLGARSWKLSIASVAATVGVMLVCLVLGAPGARADSGADACMASATDAARSSAGLPGYAWADDLAAVAQAQAERMAQRLHIYHNPNLGSDVSGWKKVGENVGVGVGPYQVQQAFMDSPGHRANILSESYTEIGIGTTIGTDGRLYIAEVFRLPSGTSQPVPADDPAPTAEAPADDPASAPEAPAAATAPDSAPQAPAAPAVNQVAAAAVAAAQVVPPVTTPALDPHHAQLVSAVSPVKVVPVRSLSAIAWIAALLAQAVLLAHAVTFVRRYRMGSGL